MKSVFLYKFRNVLAISVIIVLSLTMHRTIFHRNLIGIHVWRQSQTQLNIQNFYRVDNNILNPRSNTYNGNELQILRTDFPLMQWLISQFYFLFGEDIFITRLSMFILGMFSVIGVFLLSQLLFKSFRISCFTAFAFNFSPVFYYYTLNPIPDNLALCCMVWSLYFFVKFRLQPNVQFVILSSLFFGLAALVKLPYVIAGATYAAYFMYLLNKKNADGIKKATLFALPYLLFIIPAICWYVWVIPTWGNIPLLKGNFNYSENAARVREILYYHFTTMFPALLLNYASLFFFFCGIFSVFVNKYYKKALFWQIGAGGIMAIIYFIYEFLPIDIIHDYYMMPFLPYLFLLVGLGAKFIVEKIKYATYILASGIIIIPILTYNTVQENWTIQRSYTNDNLFIYQKELKEAVPTTEKCIMLNDPSSYVYPYLLNKTGYTFKEDNLPAEWIEDMIKNKKTTYMYSDSRVIDTNASYQYLFDKVLLERGTMKVIKLTPKDKL